MRDFGLLSPAASAPAAEIVQRAPAQVAQEVTVAPVGSAEAAYLLKDASAWTWQDLRDYVVRAAEERFGPQVRDPRKEAGIFKGFLSRYGTVEAVLIARAAFEVYQGMWHQAPVRPERFCKNSDPYFGDVILARLKG